MTQALPLSSPATASLPRRDRVPTSLLRVVLLHETDFLLARQRAKQIAHLLGFDLQDQTRIATAVSEISRNAFEYASGGKVDFFLDQPPPAGSSTPPDLPASSPSSAAPALTPPQLRIVVSDTGPGIPHIDRIWNGTYQSSTGMGVGLLGSRRLLDALDVVTGPAGTQVTLSKRLLRTSPHSLAELSAKLAKALATPHQPGSASARADVRSNALHDQNQELLSLLNELRIREAELRVINAELEETNRGVLVLYAELEDKAQTVQQASEVKTRFLSGVTHELRTPLNSIVSLSRLLLAHTDGPLIGEQEKQVNFILRSAQHLTEMVNDLLDLAKVEAGKTTTHLTDISVADLYTGLRGMFRPLANDPRVKLLFLLPDPTLRLRSDEGKLAQILRNFVSNALKFTHAGTVTVSVKAETDGNLTFSVADTGIGIAEQDMALVLEEWGQVQQPIVLHQAAGTLNSQPRGSGLGLPLSRRLAELLGGYIHFSSRPGAGSTFNLTLPVLGPPDQDGPQLTPEIESGGETPGSSSHILIASDDEVARYLLRRHLEALTRVPIEEVTSPAAVLESIRERKPSLVFLDFADAGTLDLSLVQEIREDFKAPLPIVLYTSGLLHSLAEGPPVSTETEQNDLTLIGKRVDRTSGTNDPEEQRMQIERALLQVGLCDKHQVPSS